MKNIFPLIAAPVLMVTLGFGQTSAPSSNAAPASIKGCLAGTEGKYTLAEDGTTQTFKISSSTIDLKAHVGHDVELIGQKSVATPSSSTTENTVAVTGLNMIAESCATPKASSMPMNDTTPTTASSTSAPIANSATATAVTPAATDSQPATTATSTAASDPMPNTVASSPATPASTASDSTVTMTDSSTTVVSTPPVATTSAPAVNDPPPAQTTIPAVKAAPMTASYHAPMTTSDDASEAKKLPETATLLPLLGLLGMCLVTAGLLVKGLGTRKLVTS